MNIIRKYFRLQVLLGALIITAVAIGIIVAFTLASKPDQRVSGNPTAIVNILPAPTLTPVIAPPTAFPTPTVDSGDAQAAQDLTPGAYVQVTGTGGTGLRLRVTPGLDAEVRLLGIEAEIFKVEDGPYQAEGYAWWYLVSPSDETRHGWAVEDYLVVVQNP